MLPKAIEIGPFSFHFYGLIIALAVYLGWWLAKRRINTTLKLPEFKRKQLRELFDSPILILPLILGISGGRLYHVLDYSSYYLQNPGQIIAVWQGGLGIWGALAGIFAGFWIVAKVRKINFMSLLDLIAPSLLLGQALGRIGNFINQEGFGPPTDLPWAVYISPENRPLEFINSTHFHPTFFYEAALELVFFLVLLYLPKLLAPPFVKGGANGQLFALYLILYSTARFIAEFWRIDTATIGEVKIAHLLSVLTFFIGLWLFRKASLSQ